MIFANKNQDVAKIIVECDCGCEMLVITKYTWSNDTTDYAISLLVDAWGVEQEGIFRRLKAKLKMAWFILRKGQYRFAELMVNPESIRELTVALQNIEKEEEA